ncbi:MAG: hypothetical protein KDA91_02780, partial [Planctomycetaceae bacterium]|nr:hypothetical protein [Planctomycetaceae bacterium]
MTDPSHSNQPDSTQTNSTQANSTQANSTQAQASQSAAPDPTGAAGSISDSIREVIESGKDVAQNVQALVVNLLQQQSGPIEAARSSVTEMLKTAEDVVQRSAPDSAESVLRKVI